MVAGAVESATVVTPTERVKTALSVFPFILDPAHTYIATGN